MGEKYTNSQFQRIYKLLEYLKRNTDENHRVRQEELRQVDELKGILGDKTTFGANMERLSETLNTDSAEHLKDISEMEIIYDRLIRKNGLFDEDDLDEFIDEDDELADKGHLKIGRIYYKSPFTYEEVNRMIEGLLFLDTIDTKECNQIIEKIESKLTSKFYKQSHKLVSKVYKTPMNDIATLQKKLNIIQTAIHDGVQIEFTFQGYNKEKQLVDNRKVRDTLCPYYIVANIGKYYLIGCSVTKKTSNPNMSIWRIDLMHDIIIPEQNVRNNRKGRPVIEKHKVDNLPVVWDEQFLVSHMNMSFDAPRTITLRINSPKQEENHKKAIRGDYTFLHDYFGESFRYIETEKEPPYHDIVTVKCSPYGMVNWALQYSDRVEVLAPQEVRDTVAEKVEALAKKYQIKKQE